MHLTEIVKQEQSSDEAIAVTVRCCSNPKTDSSLTIYGAHAMTPEQVEAKIDAHRDKVVAKCNAMGKLSDHLTKISLAPKTHEAK